LSQNGVWIDPETSTPAVVKINETYIKEAIEKLNLAQAKGPVEVSLYSSIAMVWANMQQSMVAELPIP